ncbi:MAG TPA: hypothetical protein VHW01_07815, partial [Polyangiaceae bacterium]|nr:hypothetical protein [Polyangiaceae bacterium]
MLLLAFACEVPNFGFANTCTNGIQGSDEPSPACQAAQGASCSDGVTNGSETDVDCGGACPACRAGQSCRADGDCDSTHCELGICQSASCDDGIANGSESDIDCGSSCTPCADSKMCHDENDCKSEVCNAGVCQQPTCTDHKK